MLTPSLVRWEGHHFVTPNNLQIWHFLGPKRYFLPKRATPFARRDPPNSLKLYVQTVQPSNLRPLRRRPASGSRLGCRPPRIRRANWFRADTEADAASTRLPDPRRS